MTELIDGRIPPHTECPYKSECAFSKQGVCYHKGFGHPVAYSCATARGFAIIESEQ